MWVEMLWIPAFAGMTEETDGLDESSPYKLLIAHYLLWADTRSAPTYCLLLFSSNNIRYEIEIAASLHSSQ